MSECRRSYSNPLDVLGAWLNGEEVVATDLWVASGLESEKDHPERYRRDDDHWCIIEEDE